MNNIQRISEHVTKHGGDNVLIHTIPGTPLWIVAEKQADTMWNMTLVNPLSNAFYQLGMVTDKDHIELWRELVRVEITRRANHISVAKTLRTTVAQFLKRKGYAYQKLIRRVQILDQST